MKRLIVAIMLVLFISAPVSAAYFITGSMLIEQWQEFNKFQKSQDHDYSKSGHYMGYVSGVADALDGIAFNIPDGITVGQLSAIVGKYIEDNPSEWKNKAEDIVINALKKAFPKKI